MINDPLKSKNPLKDFLDIVNKPKQNTAGDILKTPKTKVDVEFEKAKARVQAGEKPTDIKFKSRAIKTKYGLFYVDVPVTPMSQNLTAEQYDKIRKEIEDVQEKAGAKQTAPNLPELDLGTEPVDITAETTKNLKAWEDKYIRSTQFGRNIQDALKFVQSESEAYTNRADNPLAKFAGMMVAGMAEDAANPLATFESKVGNIYDTNSTAEEWFGALGNAALYGLSIAPFAKAGVTGQQAMKAAEQAMARGLRIKAGLVAFGRTYGRETLLGGFAERKVTISQLRNVLKKQWYADKEIDNIVSSQRKLYKMWSKTNKGDFNDFLLQQVRNETKSAEKALSKGDETVDAIGNVTDATDMADTATKALQEPDIPGYNVPTEAIENVPMSRGVANLENFFNLAKQSGAIKTPLQEKAWRRVMMARAETWAKENNVGDPMAMFENMKVTIDDVMPDSALMQSIADEVGEVSTRIITAKQSPVDTSRLLLSNMQDVNVQVPKDKDPYAKRVFEQVKRTSPIFRDAKNIDDVVKIIGENLHHIMDIADPVTKEFGKLWYDGANRIAIQWADRYGFSKSQVAAVIANNSPQKNWFENVSRAERILDAVVNKSDIPFDDEMVKWAKSKMTKDKKGNIKRQFSDELIDSMEGRTLNEISNQDAKAAWIITYDALNNPKQFRVITPDGRVGDWAKNLDGSLKKFAGFDSGVIKKSLQALEDGSVQSISESLGEAHKVRNFYNNIIDPNSSLGHYTADTHQGAAGIFKPLGGDDPEIKALLTGTGSRPLGYVGTYPIHHQAGQIVAKELGVLPRELQSMTWETIRTLFRNKSPLMKSKVSAIWEEFLNGSISKTDAWKKIEDVAGGMKQPDWIQDLEGAKYGRQTFSDLEFPNEFNKFDSMIELPNKDLLLQEEDGIARAWYNEANRQINFISGMSNFSSMVHETFHDWATMLKPEHQELLARAFGDMTTVEAKEAAARAFERYLRDGIAPEGLGLEKVFSSIKRWMTEVYNKVKGSPIEAKVDPDARRVFDEMLGSTSYGDYGITSARKQFIDADRKLLGSAKAVEAQAESFKQWMDEGNQMIDESGQDSRTWGATLAKEILNSPRPLSDKETGAMVSVMQVIKNNHKLLSDQLTGLTEATDNIKIKALNDQLSQLEKEFDELTLAVRISGTEKGRSLNAQKLTLNEDFDLISVLNRYKRRSFDGMVNDTDKAKLTELTKKIKDLESKLQDVENINVGESGRAYTRTKTEIVAARKNIADAIAQSFKLDSGKVNAFGVPSTKTMGLVVDYALTFVEEGLGKIEDVVILAEKGLSDAGLVVSRGEIKQALQAWVSSKKFKNNDLIDYLAQLKTELRNTPEVAIRPLLGGEPTKQELAHFVLSFAKAGGGRLGDMVDKAIEHLNQYPQLVNGLATGSIREDMLDAMLEWGVPKQVTRQMDMRGYQVDRAKKEIKEIIAESEKTAVQRTAFMASNTLRALKATADFSAALRQGALLGAGNPAKAIQAFNKAIVASANPAYANKLDKELHLSKIAPIRKNAGLYISEGALSDGELQFKKSFAEYIPGVKQILDISERHYTTFLNQLRIGVFDDIIARNPDMSIESQKALADFINVATGRGRMDESKFLNNVLFSPRFTASRIQAPADAIFVTPQGKAMWRSPQAKKQLLTSWSAFLGTAFTLGSLAKASGAKVELMDTDSPDWGKIRYGDTSVDLFAGFQQPVRLLIRLMKMSVTKPAYNKKTADDLVMQFAEFKLSPNVSFGLSAIDKKDPVGQPFLVDEKGNMTPKTVMQDVGKTLLPLNPTELYSLWNGKGTSTLGKAGLSGLMTLGVGVQTYDRSKKGEKAKNLFEKKTEENPFSKMFEEDKGKKKKNPFSTDFVPSEYAF
jgi:hypothetical protein